MQYHCEDKSDESVWGCAEIGKECAGLEDYWPCSPTNASAQCIHANKVCDGATGLESNDCESGEDEEPEFCRDVLFQIVEQKMVLRSSSARSDLIAFSTYSYAVAFALCFYDGTLMERLPANRSTIGTKHPSVPSEPGRARPTW